MDRHMAFFITLISILLSSFTIVNGFHLNMVSDQPGGGGSSGTQMRPKEYRNLKPLPCNGIYKPEDTTRQHAIYLAPEQMRIKERVDGRHVASGLMPIPVAPDLEFPLGAAMKTGQRATVFNGWSGATVTDRTGGIYDNLNQAFERLNVGQFTKRKIYDALRLKGSCPSPYHGIVAALDAFADLSVTGLLIEVADRPTKNTVSLGAAVLVCKEGYEKKWRLTASRSKLIRDVRRSGNAELVKCHMDELVGIALATGIPIVTKTSLYEPMQVDGLLEKSNGKIKMSAPFFASVVDEKMWKSEIAQQKKDDVRAAKRAAKVVKTAAQIPDATTFLTMKNCDKRACLRQTGVKTLPRPREGPRALDALMIPLLDEEVAYEVLRRLAETRGDFKMAANMNDFESRKPILAKQIRIARDNGESALENELIEELNALSTLKFDPTDPDNPKAVNWDVEEWYYEERKRIYGIIA